MNKKIKKNIVVGCLASLLFSPQLLLAGTEIEQQIKNLKQQLEILEQRVAGMTPNAATKIVAKNKNKTFAADKKTLRVGNTDISIGGFVKFDMGWSDYSDGNGALAGIGEDFLVPSVIPVGGDSSDLKFHAHAKASRFNITSFTKTPRGHVKTYLEFDAQGSGQGNERVSNSSAERLRHAFLEWNIDGKQRLLAGQAWSTFFNVGSLPESIDFVGPVGTIFERQAQLRYSRNLGTGNSIQFSLENPATTLYGGAENPYDDNRVPDLVARFNAKTGNLAYSLALMTRELKYETTGLSDSAQGYGLSLSGKFKLDNGDEIRGMFNYGNALGRYMSLNGFRAGVIDAQGDIELIDAWGLVASYKHHWNNQWRTNLTLSGSGADNPSYLPAATAAEYLSLHLNLLYSPVKKLTLGGEYIFASKRLENNDGSLADDKGQLNRFLFSAKYAF